MTKRNAIDPFSHKRLAKIAPRFMRGRNDIDQTATRARRGFLLAEFDDLDLLALCRAGLLTYGDISALVKLGRLPKSEEPTF